MYFSLSPSSYSSTSYSTISASSSPMDIPCSSSESGIRSRPQSPSCAFPSWPRSSSLASESKVAPSTSFIISDEELFPSVFDDADCTPPASPNSHSSRSPASPARMMVVDHAAFMRQLVAEEKAKRERRRRSKSSGGSRKSSRSSSGGSKHMSPIQEVGE